MLFKFLVLLLLGSITQIFGQQSLPPAAPVTEKPPPQAPMVLMKKSVVFIQASYKRRSNKDVCLDDAGKPSDLCRLIGTGFIIFYPDERAGKDRGFTYIVTNKHLVREPGKDDEVLGHGPYLPSIDVRINTRQPLQESGIQFTFANFLISYTNGDLRAFVHPDDPAVDLAIIPVELNPDTLDFFMLAPVNFATPKLIAEQKFDESNEVVFAGLFAPYTGAHRNYPIVRHGKLAMISTERIPWAVGQTEDLILADVMSFGGNSGSPVFIKSGGDSGGMGMNVYYLLGVMQGFYTVDSQVSVQTAQVNGIAKENTGIAAVIPVQKMLEVLESPRAIAAREMSIANFWADQGKFAEAVSLAEVAVNRIEAFDPQHQDLINARRAAATLMIKAGQHMKAAQQLRMANLVKRSVVIRDDEKK